MTPEQLAEVATGLDAATREKWAREGFRLIALRGERFGEFLRAVRELMATLPKCEGRDGRQCGEPATRHNGSTYYRCEEHAVKKGWPWPRLKHADALRKLQAMLDPEETEKP